VSFSFLVFGCVDGIGYRVDPRLAVGGGGHVTSSNIIFQFVIGWHFVFSMSINFHFHCLRFITCHVRAYTNPFVWFSSETCQIEGLRYPLLNIYGSRMNITCHGTN